MVIHLLILLDNMKDFENSGIYNVIYEMIGSTEKISFFFLHEEGGEMAESIGFIWQNTSPAKQ